MTSMSAEKLIRGVIINLRKFRFAKETTKMLLTPFGEIRILIDEKPVPFIAQEGRKLEGLCSCVLGRYQIVVRFIPDGKEHTIAYIFKSDCLYQRAPESGECLECQSFYNGFRFKMSIGLECEAGYIDGARATNGYDYDAVYLENGMAFLIDENTKTENYTFGIAWIDNVGWDDLTGKSSDRDVETWYGADPTLAL